MRILVEIILPDVVDAYDAAEKMAKAVGGELDQYDYANDGDEFWQFSEDRIDRHVG